MFQLADVNTCQLKSVIDPLTKIVKDLLVPGCCRYFCEELIFLHRLGVLLVELYQQILLLLDLLLQKPLVSFLVSFQPVNEWSFFVVFGCVILEVSCEVVYGEFRLLLAYFSESFCQNVWNLLIVVQVLYLIVHFHCVFKLWSKVIKCNLRKLYNLTLSNIKPTCEK